MIQEDRILLLWYLSMSLPYELKMQSADADNPVELYGIKLNEDLINYYTFKSDGLKVGKCEHLHKDDALQFKPYLKSLSSMTDAEELDLIVIGDTVLKIGNKGHISILSLDQMKWLVKNHYDFLGLIHKGMAIEVTEENNPYK